MKVLMSSVGMCIVCFFLFSAPMAFAATGNYSSNPNVSIPDNCSGAGFVSDVISVSHSGTITDVIVEFESNHTYAGDLIIKLTSPSGTTIDLMNRPGMTPKPSPCTGWGGCFNGFGGGGVPLIFSDAAAIDGDTENCDGDPFDGTVTPYMALTAFDGEDLLGQWTITVSDNCFGDGGDLIAWRLQIEYGPIAAIPSLNEWGMIIFTLLMAGTAVVFMRRRKDMTA